MKKLLYTFLAVSIIFATCKKEDDSSSPNGGTNNTSGSILGKWNLTQYNVTSSEGYYTNYPNGKVTTRDTSVNYTLPDTAFFESITWEFFNDQTMEEILTEYGNTDSTLSYYTWGKNGNTLALDTDWVVTINTLTANNLNWTDDSEDTNSSSSGDLEVEIYVGGGSYDYEITWDLTDASGFSVDSGAAGTQYAYLTPGDCYDMHMYDSYGDGWNGAIYTISDILTGTVLSTGAILDSGFYDSKNFCVPGSGDPTDTIYFDRFIGIASWNKISGLSPNTSNARLKQNNRKESPFSRKFINRRKR
jgi:hypothetical protein